MTDKTTLVANAQLAAQSVDLVWCLSPAVAFHASHVAGEL